jgi:hypothetical protein
MRSNIELNARDIVINRFNLSNARVIYFASRKGFKPFQANARALGYVFEIYGFRAVAE